jgi:serine/threonine protein kinase/tetratricopeptide (TPR) repeat protein
MTRLDKDRWQRVQPLLDHALDLDEGARGPYLDEVRRATPDLAGELERLLAAHARVTASDFLGGRPSLVDEVTSSLRGRTFGAYTLDRTIGTGGMGTVWLAHRSDGRFSGQVALKVVNQAVLDVRARTRFEREGTILARLTHPNIARLLDAGVTSRGQPYLVLEYVEGVHIDQYADAQRLGVRARLTLFLQVADAVAHAHANLVVHRDLKPSNILVRDDGVAKLLDFGIARLVNDDTADVGAGATRATAMVMTPKYAAPEQARDGTVTTATDVYALGVLLFTLLSGQHPTAEGATTPAEYLRALEVPAGRLSDVLGTIAADSEVALRVAAARGTTIDRLQRACRGDLDTILNVALKTDPAERYASVGALADDIRRHLRHEPVAAQPDSWWYRTRKLVARRRLETAAVAVAAVGILSGSAVAVWQARVAATERDFAIAQLRHAQVVNDLNEFLLADAGPVGKRFTAGEVLARAERIALRQHDEPPATRALALIAIGTQYRAQDEDDSARRVLAAAFDISRTLTDPSVRARAACAHAAAIADTGEGAHARQLVRDALAELPADALYDNDRVGCELRAAEIEREDVDPAAAIAHVQRAARLLETSGTATRLLQVRVAMDLAESFRAAGRPVDAAAAFEEAYARLEALGRGDTETAGTLLNNWGMTHHALGQPLDALRLFERAVAIASADGSDASVSPILLTNLARVLVDLGKVGDGVNLADRSAALADRDGNVVAYNQGLALRAAGYRQLGNLPRAALLLDEFERRIRQVLPAGHMAFTVLEIERARQSLDRGDLVAARTGIDRAVLALEADREHGREVLHRALLTRADVALAAHRFDDAAADASRALDIQRGFTGGTVLSTHAGRALLAIGQAHAAAGRRDAARGPLTDALRHLEATLGRDHREVNAARALLR